MRGSGKFNLQAAFYEAMLKGASLVEFNLIGDSITFSAHDNVYLQPAIRPELTDYNPRGADRIKGPKGPRTKWRKLK